MSYDFETVEFSEVVEKGKSLIKLIEDPETTTASTSLYPIGCLGYYEDGNTLRYYTRVDVSNGNAAWQRLILEDELDATNTTVATKADNSNLAIQVYSSTKQYSLDEVVMNIENNSVILYRSLSDFNTSLLTNTAKWETINLTLKANVGDVVNLTETQTISGSKNFTGSNTTTVQQPGFNSYSTYTTKGETRTGNNHYRLDYMRDVSGNVMGQFYGYVGSSNQNRFLFRMYPDDSSSSVYKDVMQCVLDKDGSNYVLLNSTPSSGDNSTKVATTAYVDGNAVLKTGDQTIAGTKTFSTIPKIPTTTPTVSTQVASKKYVDDLISSLETDILKSLYKVGDYFITHNTTNPATRFGGTWTKVTDRFLVGAGNTYSLTATGGAATVTLTTSQIPSHNHTTYGETTNQGDPGWGFDYTRGTNNQRGSNGSFDTNNTDVFTSSTGGGAAHNNLPPYKAVYIWYKTAD